MKKIVKSSIHYLFCFSLQITHGIEFVHSTQQKTNRIYIERDCIERFCKDLKEPAMEIINYEEKEMIRLTDKENKSYEKQRVCYRCKKKFCFD